MTRIRRIVASLPAPLAGRTLFSTAAATCCKADRGAPGTVVVAAGTRAGATRVGVAHLGIDEGSYGY